MKYTTLLLSFFLLGGYASAVENNATVKSSKEIKKSIPQKNDANTSEKKKKIAEKIKKQMELEEKYAKEQRFYQGSDYDLKAHEVDPNSLPDVPVIEPEDDFDITDVYRDDI